MAGDDSTQAGPSPSGAADAAPGTAVVEAVPAGADPGAWPVPVRCFRCEHEYAVAAKHFRTGAVLYCPRCRGSYVVTRSMYGAVRDVVRHYASQCSGAESERVLAVGEACTTALREITRNFRPPGAPRPVASVFG